MNFISSAILSQSSSNNIFELNIAKEKYKINYILTLENIYLQQINRYLRNYAEKDLKKRNTKKCYV